MWVFSAMIEVLYEGDELPNAVTDKLDIRCRQTQYLLPTNSIWIVMWVFSAMIEVLYESDKLPKAVADKLDMDHSRACVGGHWVFSIISGYGSLLTSLLVTLSDPSLSISLLTSLFTCTLSICCQYLCLLHSSHVSCQYMLSIGIVTGFKTRTGHGYGWSRVRVWVWNYNPGKTRTRDRGLTGFGGFVMWQ